MSNQNLDKVLFIFQNKIKPYEKQFLFHFLMCDFFDNVRERGIFLLLKKKSFHYFYTSFYSTSYMVLTQFSLTGFRFLPYFCSTFQTFFSREIKMIRNSLGKSKGNAVLSHSTPI